LITTNAFHGSDNDRNASI